MRSLLLVAALLVATVAGPAPAAPGASAAAPAQNCGPDFRTVERKPIREVGSGDRIGSSMIKVRTGAKPAYCTYVVFIGEYKSAKYATSLFMITSDVSGQLYDSTFSPDSEPEPVCLSTATVPTGYQLRVQVRVFVNDRSGDPPVAKAGGRLKVATTPTMEPQRRAGPKLKCYGR